MPCSHELRYSAQVEFLGNRGGVLCAAISPQTGAFVLTGGQDKRVNVWTVGETKKTMSLQGMDASVTAVAFKDDENQIVAGASNGCIRIFDLGSPKTGQGLVSPSEAVRSVQMCKHGIMAGADDGSVRVWDLRSSSTAGTFVFKGHENSVIKATFSPDGKWVVSGDDKGVIKIWDLAGNKMLTELKGHTGAITGLHFHPSAHTMGSCARDKTVRLWDLDTFAQTEKMAEPSAGVAAMAFHPKGQHLLSVLDTGLHVWGWAKPPAAATDMVDMPWGQHVRDAVLLPAVGHQEPRLLGVSSTEHNVQFFAVDLAGIKPWQRPGWGDHSNCSSRASSRASAAHASAPKPKPLRPAGTIGSLVETISGPGRGRFVATPLPPPDGKRKKAEPAKAKAAEPPKGKAAEPAKGKGGAAAATSPSKDVAGGKDQDAPEKAEKKGKVDAKGGAKAGAKTTLPKIKKGSGGGDKDSPESPSSPSAIDVVVPLPPAKGATGGNDGAADDSASATQTSPSGKSTKSSTRAKQRPRPGAATKNPEKTKRTAVAAKAVAEATRAAKEAAARGDDVTAASSSSSSSSGGFDDTALIRDTIRSSRSKLLSTSRMTETMSDVKMLRTAGSAMLATTTTASGKPSAFALAMGAKQTHETVLAEIIGGHDEVRQRCLYRKGSLELLRNFVKKGDWRGAAGAAKRTGDPAVGADLMEALLERKDIDAVLQLPLVPDLSPLMEQCLSKGSPERRVCIAVNLLTLIDRAFVPLIQDTVKQSRVKGVGVDLSADQRLDHAQAARSGLVVLLPLLEAAAKRKGLDAALTDRASMLAKDLTLLQ